MATANAPGQRGSYDGSENKENQPGGTSSSWQDPRTILVQRTEGGFGFVLRHFIVYPPDAQDSERVDVASEDPHSNKRTRLSQQDPMDTIFVMHVKEGGPAHTAGLQEGDRILSVNGQSIAGQTYAQVIGLIQASDATLRLLVVPRNEDILQVAYQSSAYNQGLDTFRGSASNIPYPPDQVAAPPLPQSRPPEVPQRRPSSSRYRSEVRFSSIDKDVDDDEVVEMQEEPQCFSTAPTMPLQSGSISSHESMDSQLSPAYLQESSDSGRIYTSAVTWPRRGSKPEEMTYHSGVSNGPPAPVRTSSKNISLSHLQRFEAKSGSLESISKSSKSSSDSSGSRMADIMLRRQDSSENSDNQGNLSVPSSRDVNRWSAPEEQRSILQYKESLRKSQEDLFSASSRSAKQVAVLSKSVTTGQLQVAHVSSAPTSPSRPNLPYTKSHTTSSLLSRNKYFDIESDGGGSYNNEEIKITVAASTTQTYSTTTYVTSTGSNTVATTSVTINPTPVGGIRYLPAYSSQLPEPVTKPQIIIRRRKSYDNILDDGPRGRGALRKIHDNLRSDSNLLPRQHRIPVKHQDTSPSHVMKIEKDYGAEGVSVTVKRTPIQDTQGGTSIVSQRLSQFEVGSYESLPSSTNVRHQFELRKLETSAQIDSVAQKAAKFDSFNNSDQVDGNNGNKKILIQIRNRQPYDSSTLPALRRPYIRQQDPPPKTPSIDLHNEAPKLIMGTAFETSKRVTIGPTGWENKSKSTSFLVDDRSYPDGGAMSSVRPQQSYSVLHSNQDRTKFTRQSSEERNPNPYTNSETSMFTSSQSMCNMSSSSTSSSLVSPNLPKVEHDLTSSQDRSPTTPPGLETDVGSVTRRIKATGAEEDNDVKLFRRISYLKATAKERGHLNLPVSAATLEVGEEGAEVNPADQPTTPTKTSIRKLKSFFGERTPKIVEATERRPQFADLSSPPGEILKEGVLTCKLALVDGRRGSDRSWKQNWCVLCGHYLYFCKEKKESQLGTQVINEDLPISIKGCTVDIAHSYTKKKHVLRLCTQNNCEYLLQADDHESMMSWINALQAACALDEEEDQTLKSQSNLIVKKSNQHDHQTQKMSPLVPPKSTVKKIAALSFRARSPGHSPGIRPRKEETPKTKDSSKELKTWKGKVVKSFKRLGSASDTLALAHHEADLDETEEEVRQTFGVPLALCPPSTFSEFIPLVVELCTTIIEVKGLEYTGIYRIPGNSATVNMLQDELNRGLDQVNVENEKWLDINAVGSLLKSFLRQLPEPLITYELYNMFIQANRIDNPEKRMLNLKRLIHELPETHFETFKHLAQHLNTVAAHGQYNKMDAKNLAIVFGPTLIRNVSEDRVAMVADMSDQCRIIESIITHNDWFFSSWDVDNEIPLDNGGEDHPPSATTQTMVADEGGLNLKELVATIVQAANKKLQERDAREAANGGPQTTFTLFGERNIDEEVSKRKYQERNIDEEVSKRKDTVKVEATSTVTATTTTTKETESRKTEISTREGIFTAKMVFLQGRQASESSLSEDVLSDPGLSSSQSTQSFQGRFGRFQNTALPGRLTLGDNQFPRRHSEEIVLDRHPSPDNRTSTSSFESAVSVQEQQRQKDISRFRKAESEGAASEKRMLDKQWVEKELRKTQEEIEEDEDCLEDFIGNTNKISRKISDFTSRMDSNNQGDSRSVTSDYSTMSSTKEVAPNSSQSDYSSNASTASSIWKPTLPPPPDKNRSHSLTNLNNNSGSMDTSLKGGKFFAVKIKPMKQEVDKTDNITRSLPTDSSEPSSSQQSSRKGRSVNFKVGGEDMSPEDKCTLSRAGSLRRGSLDSLRDFYEKNEYTASFASSSSEDGSDLLTSLTTTFDQKLRILLDPKFKLDTSGGGIVGLATAKHEDIAQKIKDVNSNSVNVEEKGNGHKRGFQDPSLHRFASDSKVGIASRFERPELEIPDSVLQKHHREIPPEGRKTRMGKVKAFVSKVEKSDSFPKSHEAPLGESSMGAVATVMSDPGLAAAKCKSASPPVRRKNASSLRKRRHTVGGIRDFEDVMTMIREQEPKPVRKTSTSAWDRLQPGGRTGAGNLVTQERTVQSWIQQERLRSSSSDVSQASSDGRGPKRCESGV
ncbi:rho GTPase-activating protein 21-like isoform X2 [Lineus longissimus]|uniref:rho GTPase-activating protein 21-like isoform X2 n=1 Tax=Lineus longissimus TaxID=88925 RepID=UPI002B4C819F